MIEKGESMTFEYEDEEFCDEKEQTVRADTDDDSDLADDAFEEDDDD